MKVEILMFLMFFPLLAAGWCLLVTNEKVRAVGIRLACIVISCAAMVLASSYFSKPNGYYMIHSTMMDWMMSVCEVLITSYIIWIGIKNKKYGIALLSFVQTVSILGFEMLERAEGRELTHHLLIDKLTIVMVLLIALIGSLIVIYAIAYMKTYHEKHKAIQDRRRFFYAILFVFLTAMFGIVLSNDLVWIYFFWEITTLCSFLLIGYTQKEEAKNNAFLALFLNLIGGLGFALAIIYLGCFTGTTELKSILSMSVETTTLIVPTLLLAMAALTKSAQLPFSKWLLGAMVAPTPVSALLHSATMVKAGVYLLIRISPLMAGNIVGVMVVLIGGISFLLMSLLAISQSDAKKVLAYSTIANLGLIVACTGIGTYEAIWAAILLIIFHGTSKSLLFLTVGATEHIIGSRDIEDMHGLIVKLPQMAFLMAVGIAGMFLAPFGMLISKWAVLKAFVDAEQVLVILIIVYGSAATLFYWTKWLGKLGAVLPKGERIRPHISRDEWAALIPLAALTIVFCVLFSFISEYLIVPFLHDMFNINTVAIISEGNQHIMTIMLGMIIVLPFEMTRLTSKEEKLAPVYMSGINEGDNRSFESAMGTPKKMYISSWYMNKYLKEERLLMIGIIVGLLILGFIAAVAIGGIVG